MRVGRLVLGVLGEGGQMGTMLARVYGQSGADVGSLSYKMGGSVSKSKSKEAQMWGKGRARAAGCSVGSLKEMSEEALE